VGGIILGKFNAQMSLISDTLVSPQSHQNLIVPSGFPSHLLSLLARHAHGPPHPLER